MIYSSQTLKSKGNLVSDLTLDWVAENDGVYVLRQRKDERVIPPSEYQELRIFCHLGNGPEVLGFWSASEMRLKTDTDDFNIYVARNVSGVQEAHRSHQVWLQTHFTSRYDNLKNSSTKASKNPSFNS